jgi:hypothetical protein
MPSEHPYATSTKVAAFEEKAATNPVRQQAEWCGDPDGDLPMIRSENGSTQPDRPDSERRVSFLGLDADDSGKAVFRDCVNATASF